MPSPNGGELRPLISIREHLESIRERIRVAAERSGRPGSSVCLVAATKTVPADRINDAIRSGVRDIGENRVQEAQAKHDAIEGPVRRHFIGHLQTNKARKALELFDVIQSIDRPDIAEALDRLSAEKGARCACLCEVKIAPEATKTGLPLEQAHDFLRSFTRYPHLALSGLMTIAPLGWNEADTRAGFRRVFQIFNEHRELFGEAPTLSMGMSDDFEMAIEEGSNMVRLGRALFGDRPAGRADL